MKLDPKVVFYLRHRRQIDEWVALRDQATSDADRYFRSLAPAFAEMADRLPGGVKTFVSLDEPKPKLFLFLPDWFKPSSDFPRAAIGFEWHRGRTHFDDAWDGVWVHAGYDKGDRLHNAIVKLLKATPGLITGMESEKWWPAWRSETPANSEYWNDLPGFADQVVRAVESHWGRFSAAVDQAVRETS